MNVVILMGRLTRDVEVRYGQESGKAVGRFSLAVERDYVKQGEERKADFPRCVAFDKTAEFIAKHFKKGNMIAINGRLQTDSYEKDGQTHYTMEVVIDKAKFTGERREDSADNAPAAQSEPPSNDGFVPIPDNLDDLPFN
jgi:single-strand DNA-binding protein